jgi:hypothetical protein
MNRSIIIENIDNAVFERLKLEAKKQGTDLKTIIIKLLQNSLGLPNTSDKSITHSDLDKLAGTWSEEEYLEFNKNISSFNKVDTELWN